MLISGQGIDSLQWNKTVATAPKTKQPEKYLIGFESEKKFTDLAARRAVGSFSYQK